MNVKKFLLAGLAAFAVIALLGGLWHKVLLGNFYGEHFKFVADINMVKVIIGFFLTGFLLSAIYPIGYKGGSPASEGYRFGMLMGAVWMVPTAFVIFLGAGLVTPVGVVVDMPWHILIEEGIAGLVIGLVYGKIPSSR
jgi:hypothetical protein